MTPNLSTWRPCDATETAEAWRQALKKNGPSALVFSRQGTTAMPRNEAQIGDIAKGGYVLKDAADPQIILIATGSEVGVTMEAAAALESEGLSARVVSMPSTSYFDAQDRAYREAVLPASVPKLAVEAAHADYWYKYVGHTGDVVGMTTFGESAPGGVLLKHFGFTAENIAEKAKALLV